MSPLEKALALGQMGVWLAVVFVFLEQKNMWRAIGALGRRNDRGIRSCTRPPPHVCLEDGPCNGWPVYREPGRR